ncbi:U6 snRNA phosphodiesterase Usb1 [Annulohypoxylon bovei var. microspora]|nr:U6 snRNA phosphodiesterase Usb1 [Annulohypoxylon bovei var. microspora]
MALVDYSSSDSESAVEEAASAAVKRQKTSHTETADGESSALPPLPAAFHDLYASTVRVSTTDDPTLHQGRKRVNPHKAGNWPSHLYIEWHPTPPQLRTLSTLLSALQPALSVDLTSFLTSDLGAPQPLHVSLSRPIVLGTGQRDGFLEELVARVGGCGVAPFDLAPRGLEWHRTRESARSFLVLRVAGAESSSDVTATTAAEAGLEEGTEDTSGPSQDIQQNPHLTALLQRCNALVQEYAQPPLYAFKANSGDSAFHISIAWSFAAPTPEIRRRTEEIFARHTTRDEIRGLRVHVDGLKAKIGNAITHVPLPARGKRGREDSA